MVKASTVLTALVAALLVLSTASSLPAAGGSEATVSMSGYTQASSYNPQKYQFSMSNTAALDLSGAVGEGLSGDAFVNAFKGIFGKAPESGATVPTVSGSIKGTKNGDKVDLIGSITVKWSVNGGKGQKQVAADLKGSMSANGGNIALAGENVKVGGTWHWGGSGGMELKGEATLSISSK